jgi:uncharacterized protein with GYD domain
MPLYLLQFAYTPEAWAALARRPENRVEAARGLLEGLGGRLVAASSSFGEYDGVLLAGLPDNTASAAASLAANAAGHLKALTTTPLLTVEETLEAMRRAGGIAYRGPASPAAREAAGRRDREGAEAAAHTQRGGEADAVTTDSMDSMAASDPPAWPRARS